MVAKKQAGDTVTVEYYRGADKHTATVKLGERPAQLSNSSSGSGSGGGSGGGSDGLPFNLP
jgi:hypothetical protein